MGRFSKDKRDVFYRQAKESGYRARSAFKLLQLDEAFDLFTLKKSDVTFRRVERAVDLCAAPGSWSQVLTQKLYQDVSPPEEEEKARIVAVDLQPMTSLPGVRCMEGDITSLATATAIIDHFEGRRAELVVCDGAPDVTGMHDFDEFVQGQLVLSAVNIATHILCPRGTFVAKTFRSRDCGIMYSRMCQLFEKVSIGKPTTCRNSSIESFLVCQGFFGGEKCNNANLQNGGIDLTWKPTFVPFVACQNIQNWDAVTLMDSDKSYPVQDSNTKIDKNKHTSSSTRTVTPTNTNSSYVQPIAPPIRPPYEASIAKAKESRAKKNTNAVS